MSHSSYRGRRSAILALAATALALMAAPATAAEGDPFLNSCISQVATENCTAASFVQGTSPMALSADGKHLYLGVQGNGESSQTDGLVLVDVAANGALSRRAGTGGCLTKNGNPPAAGQTPLCQAVPTMGPVRGLLLVQNTLYVTSYASNLSGSESRILVFDRNPTTGALTQKASTAGCIADGSPIAGCAGAPALTFAGAMAAKPDGTALYVRTRNGLAVFTRAGDGTLTQKAGAAGCWQETPADTGCTDGVGISNNTGPLWQMAIAGSELYVPSSHHGIDGQIIQNGGIAVLRIGSDGSLTQDSGPTGGCITNNGQSGNGGEAECVDGSDALLFGRSVAARGSDVYLGTGTSGNSGVNGPALFHFRRNASGLLGTGGTANGQATGCLAAGAVPGCTPASGISDVVNLALTPDGTELIAGVDFANTNASDGLVFLRRDTTAGTLTQRADPKDCILSHGGFGGECEALPQLGNETTIAVAPDGLRFFVASRKGAVLSFDRDFAPVCQPFALETTFNTSALATLKCSDANGDPIAYEITRQPANGSLAAVDQAAGTVRYSPSLGYSGADAFGYRAVARGVASAPAEASIKIGQAPPDPGGGGDGPVDKDGDGFNAAQDCNDADARINPRAQEIAGNAIDENCDSVVAPFPKIAAGIDYGFDARNARFTTVTKLRATSVPAGATVEVRCRAKKGCRFQTKRVTVTAATPVVDLRKFFNAKKKKRKVVSKLSGGTIELRITAPDAIGKVVTFKIVKLKSPSPVVTCLPVGATVPQATC